VPDPDSCTDPVQSAAINPADIRLAAMNLLARREHSLWELRRKLKRRFGDEQLLAAELTRLAEQNLQSDVRFAESFVRHRVGRGCGPLRLRREMRERGLSDSEIALALDGAEVDWHKLATEVFNKKFGATGAADLKEKARRIRFMQYRGFAADHFQHLLDD
jgi:regulatory protein